MFPYGNCLTFNQGIQHRSSVLYLLRMCAITDTEYSHLRSKYGFWKIKKHIRQLQKTYFYISVFLQSVSAQTCAHMCTHTTRSKADTLNVSSVSWCICVLLSRTLKPLYLFMLSPCRYHGNYSSCSYCFQSDMRAWLKKIELMHCSSIEHAISQLYAVLIKLCSLNWMMLVPASIRNKNPFPLGNMPNYL